MTPLTREERDAILQAHPSAAPGEIEADIAEYEQLVSEMFATDPSSVQPSGSPAGGPGVDRLNELHAKLFG
jgi:hypothetical protein